jgi:catechol 2,3-dioxygenase-like lactoylglutathione lyase family enzyme
LCKSRSDSKRPGIIVAFHAESPALVDVITEELKARGVTILYPDKHPMAGGSYGVFFEDPDRIKVELVVSS